MTPEGRAELRRLHTFAVDNKWGTYPDDPYVIVEGFEDGDERWVADGASGTVPLIVAAVNALPALLDALDKAEGTKREAIEHAYHVTTRANLAEAALNRVRALADDMETWCSPDFVAVRYAKRIHEALDGAQ